jgi:hypothetical protein
MRREKDQECAYLCVKEKKENGKEKEKEREREPG